MTTDRQTPPILGSFRTWTVVRVLGVTLIVAGIAGHVLGRVL